MTISVAIQTMPSLSDWLPSTLVGITFTLLACLKIYGRRRGIVGGGSKPWTQRCLGSCPSWSRRLNLWVIALFLVIGLANLAWAACSFGFRLSN